MNDDSLNLLLFSVWGVSFGIDADQVAEITAYKAETEDLVWFHDEMGYGDKKLRYHSPTIVTIKTDREMPYRVIIDSMQDITQFNWNDITPFPALMEPFSLQMGMWGILSRQGSMVLLLDFQRLLRNKLNELK